MPQQRRCGRLRLPLIACRSFRALREIVQYSCEDSVTMSAARDCAQGAWDELDSGDDTTVRSSRLRLRARLSLRAEQVAQTRSKALSAAGRLLFGRHPALLPRRLRTWPSRRGSPPEPFTTTSRRRPHFSNRSSKTCTRTSWPRRLPPPRAPDNVEFLSRAFESFLDAVLEPDVQRILITDAPAVLGLARFTG